MESWFFFGPEKIPFRLLNDGMVDSDSTVPFHGIISRGILNQFIKNNLDPQLWYQYAHYLDNHIPYDGNLPDEFILIKEAAESCRFLGFGRSAQCVKIFVEKYCQPEKQMGVRVDYWNIKEGHTSSVWIITIQFKDTTTETFVVNVARDWDANVELKASSEKLKTIGEQIPDINMAKVYEIKELSDAQLPGNVVITRNELIENAYEIHSRFNKEKNEEELLMVERFLTLEYSPAKITSVLGRVFTPHEFKQIKNEINNFLNLATTCLSMPPEININDGDVVWNGEKAIIVAIN